MTVQTRDFILESVRELHRWTRQGYSPREAIKRSEHLWLNKKQWEKDKDPSPLHRPTNDGSEPSFIITPDQLLLLVPLVDNSNPNQAGELLDLSADRLSSSAAFVKLTDRFSDILTLSLDKCKKDPEVQNSVAQRNCDLIIETAKANLQALSYKREAEESAIRAHQLIAQMVAEEQKRQVGISNQDTGKELEQAPKASIKVPGKD